MKEDELRLRVQQNPGDPAFADLIALLMARDAFGEAILVGLKGVSSNPDCHKGRLLLAHALFRAGCVPFAAREIGELITEFPDKVHLKNLLNRLRPDSVTSGVLAGEALEEGKEVADIEFDPDALDEL
jgi:hypothetical protein